MIAYKYVKNVDIARMAFGQSVSVSPVQLLTAAAAAVNGGELLKPHVISAYLDDNGEVVQSFEKEVVGTPISEETSAAMRQLLENAVENGGGRNAYIAGYRHRRQDRHGAEVCGRQGQPRQAHLLVPGLCADGRPGDRPAADRGRTVRPAPITAPPSPRPTRA